MYAGLQLVILCEQEFLVSKYGNEFPKHDVLYQEKSVMLMYIE